MKILVVEDEKNMRVLLSHLLAKLPNVEVIEASSGHEAWQLLEHGLRPDLCMTDLDMPEMGGIELVQRIRSSAPLKHLKVIMCSAVKERRRVEEALSLDVSGYVLKPFSVAKVHETVRRVLKIGGEPLKPGSTSSGASEKPVQVAPDSGTAMTLNPTHP